MKTGKYKTPEGEELDVVEFDEANKSVRVDLGSGQSKWYSETDYALWECLDVAEKVLPDTTQVYVEPKVEETISGVNNNPIMDEPKKKERKRIAPKPAAKKDTKKKKK